MPKKAIHNLIQRYNPNQPGHLSNDKAVEQTLQQIKELNVPANPIHYTLIFEAINEIDPYLAKEVQKAITSKTYDNNTAEALFIELISQFIYQTLPTEEVESLLNELLEGIATWLNETKTKEEFITSEIEIVSQVNLPTDVTQRLNNNILPTLQSIFADTQNLQELVSASALEITQLKNELEQAKNIAKTDELTNIPNRRGFNEIITQMASSANINSSSFALIMIDIDFFKAINDEFGHLIGDSVLRYLAKQLDAEIKGKDALARIGGEEFVILLPQTSYDNAFNVANNLRKKVEKNRLKVKTQDKPLSLTISAGLATYQLGEDIEDLIDRADQALYQAKNSGRNKVYGDC
ncbi:MAG: GGDEF domain-containing protein [Pseudomonadota bacterium]|nr:GGDEF domain-containing protein [Pseudomonadota bacterium]